MNKEFVPYEQSLALRELEFDEPCLRVGNPNGHTMWKWIEVDGEPPTVSINDVIQVHYDENWTQIPTFSQAFRWMRDKYKLYPEINLHDREDEQTWRFSIIILGEYNLVYNQNIAKDPYHKTYEEAELACLEKLIEIVKKK